MELIAYLGSLLFTGVLYSISLYAIALLFKISNSVELGNEGKLVAYSAALMFGLVLLYAGTYNLFKSQKQHARHKKMAKLCN